MASETGNGQCGDLESMPASQGFFFTLMWNGLALLMLMSLATYWIPQFIWAFCLFKQDFKDKYQAKWAVVTGGSSGIGKALVERLASQGINVVIVAFPDTLLTSSMEEFKKKYPSLEFRSVGVNMAKEDYIKDVIEATKDIDVSILFSNAGYIHTQFFADSSVEAQLRNHHVNATSTISITHHFIRLMQHKRLRGCVAFTSSPAGLLPTPSSVMYGATKAWLTSFGASLAGEVKQDGIDVCVIHPSPIASNFYQNAPDLDSISLFKKTVAGPEVIADALFSRMGRTVICDQGYFAPMVRTLFKIFDWSLLVDITTLTAHTLEDSKKLRLETMKLRAMNTPIDVTAKNQ